MDDPHFDPMQVDNADDFTSYDENMIHVNCERMIDISSRIEIVNDWVGKDEIIELLKLQINQLKVRSRLYEK